MCKGRCDFFKRNSVVLCVVIALLVIVVLYLSCSKTNCVSENLIIAFIAAVASMVVIGNFSQVLRIQDETERKMKEEIEKFRKEWEDKIKAKDDDIERLEKEIREVDFYSLKDENKIMEEKDKEDIVSYLEGIGRVATFIQQIRNEKIVRYYFVITDRKEATIVTNSAISFRNGGVREVSDDDYIKKFDDEETQEEARNKIKGWKELFGLD